MDSFVDSLFSSMGAAAGAACVWVLLLPLSSRSLLRQTSMARDITLNVGAEFVQMLSLVGLVSCC